MYLFIFEDGSILKSETFNDDEKVSCDDGYLSVVDLSTVPLTEYFNGEWRAIEKVVGEDG